MRITLNGDPAEVAATTVARLVTETAPGVTHGYAVAVNGEVVPRADHQTTALAEGDVVDVVTAVQGG